MLELKKAKFRWKQFGGWRMIKAYIRLGVLPVFIKEVVKVVFSKQPLKMAYPGMSKAIEPILRNQYSPLLKRLGEKYGNLPLEHKRNDTVYSSWMQGYDKAPLLVKTCLSSQKKYIKDKKFVLITSENQHEYIVLPEFIEEKCRKGIIPFAVYTDLVRLELLIKYGGTWIDSTVLCADGNYPKEMLDSDMFLYWFKENKNDEYTGFSSWFISSCSNNEILLIARDLLYQYWRDYDCLIDYFIFHKFLWMLKDAFPEKFSAMPQYCSYDALQIGYVLEKPCDDKKMDEFLRNSSFHKLDYRKSKKYAEDGKRTYYKRIIDDYATAL